MKKIITVQHTQSIHHINGMVGSWTDWDITEKGIRQAEIIGVNLAEELEGEEVKIYSSDLLRAKHTADIIAHHLGLKVILRENLRERNLGIAVGKSVQWLRENMERKEKTVDDRMFSDAESRRDVWNRLESFFDEIISDEETATLITVSHGDTLSVFNTMFLCLDVEALNKGELFGMAAGVSIMHITDDGRHTIRRLSDMSYSHFDDGAL